MSHAEYVQHDATSLAALVQTGQVTPAELLDVAIARTEAVNPLINAMVTPLYNEGRRMAEQLPVSGPLRGVPFLLKDLELEWAGTPLKSGCRGYERYVSAQDSTVVGRLKQAGLVFFGKTNTPEFGLTPYTESQLYGPARNPWSRLHSPGGSSGGSAAAVAAGIVPAASASDGGGSIRIPASCCGLFGLKTSRGRAPLGPKHGEMWSGAVVGHAVTRSVRDSATLLDAMAGPSPGDPYALPKPETPFADVLHQPVGTLRIAFTTEHPFPGKTVHPECVKAVEDAARLLESLGHSVERVPLPYQHTALSQVFLTMVLSETGATLRDLGDYLGRPARRSDVEMNTWALSRLAVGWSAVDVAYQKRQWNELTRRMAALHQTYDIWLTPVMSRPPIQIGELQNTDAENQQLKLLDAVGGLRFLKGSKVIDQLAEKSFGYIPFTPIQNMTGQPSMSVPFHQTPDGLPVGVMFTADMAQEGLLLRLARQLEEAKPWFAALPTI